MKKLITAGIAFLIVLFGSLVLSPSANASWQRTPSNKYRYCLALADALNESGHYPYEECYASATAMHNEAHTYPKILAGNYQNANYTGWILWWVAGNPCSEMAHGWFVNHMPKGWNDRVSSVRTFDKTCFNYLLFQDANFGNKDFANCGYPIKCNYVAFNDTASSEYFSKDSGIYIKIER